MPNLFKIDFSAFTRLAHLVRKEGQEGITPCIQTVIEDLGMVHRDHSDGEAIHEIFTAAVGDEVLELEHIEVGLGSHRFSLNRYKRVDSESFDFGGLLAQC